MVDISSSFTADTVSPMKMVAARPVEDLATVGEDDSQAPRMEEVLIRGSMNYSMKLRKRNLHDSTNRQSERHVFVGLVRSFR